MTVTNADLAAGLERLNRRLDERERLDSEKDLERDHRLSLLETQQAEMRVEFARFSEKFRSLMETQEAGLREQRMTREEMRQAQEHLARDVADQVARMMREKLGEVLGSVAALAQKIEERPCLSGGCQVHGGGTDA